MATLKVPFSLVTAATSSIHMFPQWCIEEFWIIHLHALMLDGELLTRMFEETIDIPLGIGYQLVRV